MVMTILAPRRIWLDEPKPAAVKDVRSPERSPWSIVQVPCRAMSGSRRPSRGESDGLGAE
jgi:hypothetical protein